MPPAVVVEAWRGSRADARTCLFTDICRCLPCHSPPSTRSPTPTVP